MRYDINEIARAEPCPCGHSACKDWLIHPWFALQGAGVDKKTADEIVRRINGGSDEIRKHLHELAEKAVGDAQDNLLRARARFRGLSAEQLTEEYGDSGTSCQQILSEYEATLRRAEATQAYVRGLTT